LSPVSGDSQATISNANDLDLESEDNNVIGLHLFAEQNLELESRYINPSFMIV